MNDLLHILLFWSCCAVAGYYIPIIVIGILSLRSTLHSRSLKQLFCAHIWGLGPWYSRLYMEPETLGFQGAERKKQCAICGKKKVAEGYITHGQGEEYTGKVPTWFLKMHPNNVAWWYQQDPPLNILGTPLK